MKYTRVFTVCLTTSLFAISAAAQRPEVSISLNETFFDSLLDAVFQNSAPIEFSIASNDDKRSMETPAAGLGFARAGPPACKQVIQLLRENNGVSTAVRFRAGKIHAPLAFTGNYNTPFVGCVPFSGVADTLIDLEFDQQNQRLVARARVLNVALNGTGGVGGSLIAKMVQSSIDKKVNPIEIFRMEKLSFPIPVQNAGSLRMKASGVRHDVEAGLLRIHIAYEFSK